MDQRRRKSTSSFPHWSTESTVKMAGIAIRFNVRLRSSDMPPHMQEHALRSTRSLLDNSSALNTDSTRPPNSAQLARSLKKEFDWLYGAAWHCVIGESFGSFVSHSASGFIYFSIDSLSVLLFKTQLLLIAH